MEIFHSSFKTRDIIYCLEKTMQAKHVETQVFKDTPDMMFIYLIIDLVAVKIIFFNGVDRYSFRGNLIKIETKNEELSDLIKDKITKSLGGIVSLGDYTECFDKPSVDNSEFLLNRLLLKGIDEQSICDHLENLNKKLKEEKKND